jgi:hypothetical protein
MTIETDEMLKRNGKGRIRKMTMGTVHAVA